MADGYSQRIVRQLVLHHSEIHGRRDDVRRTHKDLEQSEESRSVFDVQNVLVEERVEFIEEIRVLPVIPISSARMAESRREETNRLCFIMSVNNPLRARIAIVPPVIVEM